MKTHPFCLFVLALLPLTAIAERADRDKPIQLEARRISVDEAKKIQTLEGDVVLTQGSMVIRSSKIVVTEDKYGFQHGVATSGPGGLAKFRQKREGRSDYFEGEAERIEYNSRNETAEFFQQAWIKSGEDQVRGDYIWYDAISEKYLATAGEGKDKDAKSASQRVRVVIQPRNKGSAIEPEEGSSNGPLKPRGTNRE